jgi:peptide/nickel transport system ATP-binding protein
MSEPPLLEIREVTKRYAGSQAAALDQFSLVVPESPATITTIAGESGSGKTTLANTVLGFVGPSSGSILFRGRDIARLKRLERFAYRRNVQAIFQDPYAGCAATKCSTSTRTSSAGVSGSGSCSPAPT